jgi:hypothetical protein
MSPQRTAIIDWTRCHASVAEEPTALALSTAEVNMSEAQFTPSLVLSPALPPCPGCGGKMTRAVIEGVNQRSLRCKECGYPENIRFNFRATAWSDPEHKDRTVP